MLWIPVKDIEHIHCRTMGNFWSETSHASHVTCCGENRHNVDDVPDSVVASPALDSRRNSDSDTDDDS